MFNIGLESFRIIDNEIWCFVVSNNLYIYNYSGHKVKGYRVTTYMLCLG